MSNVNFGIRNDQSFDTLITNSHISDSVKTTTFNIDNHGIIGTQLQYSLDNQLITQQSGSAILIGDSDSTFTFRMQEPEVNRNDLRRIILTFVPTGQPVRLIGVRASESTAPLFSFSSGVRNELLYTPPMGANRATASIELMSSPENLWYVLSVDPAIQILS